MCGRFASRTDAAIEHAFGVTESHWADWSSFNVAPSMAVPVVREHEGVRQGVMLRWGLIPFWARGEPPKYSTINARAEGIDTAASYRGPWRRGQRCVIPALGFYEWKGEGKGKQPFYIRLAGGEPFGLLGLWDCSVGPDGKVVESVTIITVPANPLVADIHAKGRMPAMALASRCPAWLQAGPEDARAMLLPFPADQMDAYPVSTRVNSPRNDGPDLVEPIVP
ncbi:SOS response-associated peptidase [Thioalkalivibrio sulfidiphilus]|uniref:SOS response-associated peptidase n=1 Tax=Thioalkalivibrio sulfidiphilus TaxID=1033854 RepID=UPI000477CC82|nr:SOS response-associated peptidase [Thioalkalivibrio sulfidiphilus]